MEALWRRAASRVIVAEAACHLPSVSSFQSFHRNANESGPAKPDFPSFTASGPVIVF
jgi:hypothetical protein